MTAAATCLGQASTTIQRELAPDLSGTRMQNWFTVPADTAGTIDNVTYLPPCRSWRRNRASSARGSCLGRYNAESVRTLYDDCGVGPLDEARAKKPAGMDWLAR